MTDPTPNPTPAPTPAPAPAPAPPPSPAPSPAPSPSPTPAKFEGGWWRDPDLGFDADTVKFYDGKNYPDQKVALASLRHADQIARDRNVLPKPDADPDKRGDWEGWEQLGWVKDAGKYAEGIKKPELKQGQVLDEAMFSSFQKDAHELRIPQGAAQELFNRQFGAAYERIAAMDAAGATAAKDLDTQLRGEWGDKYEVNVELSKRAMKALGIGMDDSAELERAIGSPRLVKLFAGVAEKLGEDNLVSGQGDGGGSLTPQAARAQRLQMEADPAFMKVFNDARHPQHADKVAQRQRLIDAEAKKR